MLHIMDLPDVQLLDLLVAELFSSSNKKETYLIFIHVINKMCQPPLPRISSRPVVIEDKW